jgi:hypothetical protein
MTHVMFKCPITGTAVATGLSASQYAALPDTTQMQHSFTCQACGLLHTWHKAEAWLEPPKR